MESIMDFQFRKPNGINEEPTAKLLNGMKDALGISGWDLGKRNLIALSPKVIRQHLLGDKPAHEVAQYGCNLTLLSDSDETPCVVSVVVGGQEWMRNGVSFTFLCEHTPRFESLRACIECCDLEEAYLLDEFCSESTDSSLYIGDFVSLAPYLCGLHYFGPELTDRLGGRAYCCNAPAHAVELIRDGVLLRLTEETFTRHNPAHRQRQSAVMEYLKLHSVTES